MELAEENQPADMAEKNEGSEADATAVETDTSEDENVEVIDASGADIIVRHCPTWNDFIQEIRLPYDKSDEALLDLPGRTRLFRGHADSSWKLSSVWERFSTLTKSRPSGATSYEIGWTTGNTQKMRDSYLERFKTMATGTLGVRRADLCSDDEWWALGRHYGLITPLLDWSYSPYVAAFFAFSYILDTVVLGRNAPEGDGCVSIWCLTYNNAGDDIFRKDKFELVTCRTDNAPRQKAQQGVFTKLSDPVHLDVESYLKSRKMANRLERFDIPQSEFYRAIYDLDLMSVNSATVYPDLEGAARASNLRPDIIRFLYMNAELHARHGLANPFLGNRTGEIPPDVLAADQEEADKIMLTHLTGMRDGMLSQYATQNAQRPTASSAQRKKRRK